MKPYPAYKDSGIEWIGDIPQPWEMVKLKYWVTLVNEKTQNGNDSAAKIALENIEGFTGRLLGYGSFEGVGNKFEAGDVLFNKLRPYLCKAVIAPDDGLSVGELLVLRPEKHTHNRFLLYRLLSKDFIAVVDGSTYGAKMPRASWEFIGDLKIPFPSLPEQRAIADYLDRKTQQIDTLIAKKQRQIKLLKEQRTALINQAVTKGLNPAAPMKDSGIEWLGEVPEHWEMVKLSYVANVFNGTTPSRSRLDYWQDGTIPWLSSGKVNDYVVETPSELITQIALQETSLSMVPRGSVIMGMIGQGKTRGMSAFLDIEACINQNLAAIVPNEKLYGKYLHHFLVTAYEPIREDGRGANQEALNCQIVAAFRIPLPPKNEQIEIADYLERKIAQIDVSIGKADKAIELLQEYRITLISEAVTGKIDVRGGRENHGGTEYTEEN
jgi:type I restriction enzyme S subunit